MSTLRIIGLIFAMWSSAIGVHAQTVLPDTLAAVTLRPPDTTLVTSFYTDPDFDYRGEVAESESLLSRAWSWLMENIILPLLSNGHGELRWPVYALMALGVGYAVTKLLRLEGKSMVFGRGAQSSLKVDEIDDLAPLDLKAMLQDALTRSAYREALRLYYLRLLQRMAEDRLIVWHPEKTNAEYVNEVAGWPHQASFRDLTNLYDYVWYGDFPVDIERFETLRQAFDRFFEQMDGHAV
ncbi:MAG: hypothetical protein RhofKO_05850 [Rhodothermales bacterium]